MFRADMGINVYEDQETGEAVITLGQRFDATVIRDFIEAFSRFEQDRNFLINLKDVEGFGFSSLTLLLLLSSYLVRDKSRIYVTRCNHNSVNKAVKFPLFKVLFKI
jgi:hypothetical protein